MVDEMQVWQTKEMTEKVFLSLGDDLKVKMIQQQFIFPSEHLSEVKNWLSDNTDFPYKMESHMHEEISYHWIMFVDAEDATAFKLKWM